jgi:tetratricopeptide (TPR) repeat protein
MMTTSTPIGPAAAPRRWGRKPLVLPIAVAVGVAAVVAFLPALNNRFVNAWDDGANFLQNPAFRGLGWPQVRWAWTTLWQGAYQPLAWLVLEAEYCVVGLDPWGYHLVSLALHAVNAILFFALIRALVSRASGGIEPGRRWALPLMSGLAAAMFAVHPLRVEVVAWASCQPYLPCAGSAMLSVLAYLRSQDEGRRRLGWLLASAGLYAAALGFKAIAVGLPLVLLILDASVLQRLRGRWLPLGAWVEKSPFLAPAAAASYLAIQAKGGAEHLVDSGSGGAAMALERAAVAAYGLCDYLRQTVWPTGLSAYHYRPVSVELSDPPFAGSLACVLALGIAAVVLGRRRPAIPAALLAYAALLAPNLGLVSYDLMLVADRYAYLATMPLFVLAAGGLIRMVAVSRRPRMVALAIVVAGSGLVATWSAMSRAQCRTWRDSDTQVAHALRVGSGRDAMLMSHHGLDLLAAGRVREGMAHLRLATRIDPADPEAWENLGIALVERGDTESAIPQLAEAVRLAPDRFEFRHHLGRALYYRGRLDEAVAQLNEAVRLRPDRAQVHASLGEVLAALHRRDEAAIQFAEALRLEPDHAGARSGLAGLSRPK